jgi:hypothetical protein
MTGSLFRTPLAKCGAMGRNTSGSRTQLRGMSRSSVSLPVYHDPNANHARTEKTARTPSESAPNVARGQDRPWRHLPAVFTSAHRRPFSSRISGAVWEAVFLLRDRGG